MAWRRRRSSEARRSGEGGLFCAPPARGSRRENDLPPRMALLELPETLRPERCADGGEHGLFVMLENQGQDLDHLALVLEFLLDRHDGQTSPQVAQVAGFLKSVARHWAKADDLILLQMQKVASRLSTGRRGLTVKNRERLRPFDDPQAVALFLDLPQHIRREVEKDSRAPVRKAVTAQMAAAIAILQAVPLRIGNLAKIDIRKNLIARGKRIYLVISEGDTKNGEPVDFELPTEVVEILGWYIREYRPRLVRASTQALFPGAGSEPKSAQGFGAQLKATAFRFGGLKSTPTFSATSARRSSSTSGRASTRSSDRFSAIVRSRALPAFTPAPRRAPPDSRRLIGEARHRGDVPTIGLLAFAPIS